MGTLDYILDGLEAELALERELGVRSFEIDRGVLAPVADSVSSVGRGNTVGCDTLGAPEKDSSVPIPPVQDKESVAATPDAPRTSHPTTPQPPKFPTSKLPALDFIFLHDKPLSAKGIEMMAKIVVAMGKTAETAPVIIAPPVPPARIRIVLGGLALRKWFPGKNVAPGQWFTDEKGAEVLVTYTPEYILRFGTITPALKKIKQGMWTSLKGVLRKVNG